MKEFLIPTNKGVKPVMEDNIIRVEASSNYCKIFFMNERPLVVAKVLQWFEDKLPTETFCRIHRGHIINRLYVTDVTSENILTLINGDTVQVSRRRKEQYKNLLRQTA